MPGWALIFALLLSRACACSSLGFAFEASINFHDNASPFLEYNQNNFLYNEQNDVFLLCGQSHSALFLGDEQPFIISLDLGGYVRWMHHVVPPSGELLVTTGCVDLGDTALLIIHETTTGVPLKAIAA